MKTFLNIFAILLLLFNGIGAIYGGGNLILQPDGNTIQLSMDWLKHTPFNDYFIPGIVLFIANGLFSFIVIASIIFRSRYYPRLIMAQGVILFGWIIIQILLIQTIYFLHIILGCIGITSILIGNRQWKYQLK